MSIKVSIKVGRASHLVPAYRELDSRDDDEVQYYACILSFLLLPESYTELR